MTAPQPGSFAVLWDMDGVLVDSGEGHYQSWQSTLDEAGIPFNRELFRQTFGMNNRGILTVLLGHPPEEGFLERISERKESRFRHAIRGQVRPLPGVLHWLEHLKAMGARQAVASSAPQANVDALVDELGIRPYFEVLVSAYALPGKPDPAVFLEAARRIAIPPGRCVVVEDAIAGVQAARHAGMKCIGVATTNPPKALTDADVIVGRLDQLAAGTFERLVGT